MRKETHDRELLLALEEGIDYVSIDGGKPMVTENVSSRINGDYLLVFPEEILIP
jgi:hypothetical protein